MARIDIARRILGAFLCLIATSVAQAASVAMIADCVGDASTRRDEQVAPCAILRELRIGDRLEVAAGASVVAVYFGSGEAFTLKGPADAVVGPKRPRTIGLNAPKMRRTPSALAIGFAPEDRGADDGDSDVPGLRLRSPVGAVFESRPDFRWSADAPARRYRVSILDAATRVVVRVETDSMHIELPPGIVLVPGEFHSWEVVAIDPPGTEARAEADFIVLAASERKRFEKFRPAPGAPFAERVVYAAILEQNDLRGAAKTLWRALAAERPNDPGLARKAAD